MSYKEFVSDRIENIRDSDLLTFAAAMGLAPWLVPIAPALVFGWFFYTNVTGAQDNPMEFHLALVGAVAIAIGLIVAGAMSSHVAVTLQSIGAEKSKVNYAWRLVIAYIVLEIGGLLAMEIFGAYLIIVGIVASLLTFITYQARSLATNLTEEKRMRQEEQEHEQERLAIEQAQAREDEIADRAHQRELERLELEMKQAQAMAKIEAKKETTIAKLSVPKTVSGSVPEMSQVDTNLSQNDQKQAILDALTQDPDTNVTQFCDTHNMSRSTFYRRAGELKDEGRLKVNGHGYEVIG